LEPGKRKRLNRIFRADNRVVIVPMDHGVTIGPTEGLVDMQETISKLLRGGVDALVLHKGPAKHINTGKAGLIVHMSGATQLGSSPDNKIQVCSVEEAVRIGADAASVHVNVGADKEDRMLEKLGRVADDCDKYGMPLLAMMYPRGPKIQDPHGFEVIAHAARVGAELGADIVKIDYTGDAESFREVVRGCYVPVIIAGGPKVTTDREILQMVYDSLKAGGAGLSIGRNVFQRENPTSMVKALSAIVHKRASVDEALRVLGESK
jgi:predicted phospho-2-dehydro-3-deoxyheptonate aldolase